MKLEIREETEASLKDYSTIRMAFEVRQVIDVASLAEGTCET